MWWTRPLYLHILHQQNILTVYLHLEQLTLVHIWATVSWWCCGGFNCMIWPTFLWIPRTFGATTSDASLRSAHLHRSRLISPSCLPQTTNGSGLQETGGECHQTQTDHRSPARCPGGPQWKPHARRSPRIRITFPRPGCELPVRGAASDQVPPAGERGFEGGAEQPRPCSGYSGKDSGAVEEKQQPGEEPPVYGGVQGRSHRGREAEGRKRMKTTCTAVTYANGWCPDQCKYIQDMSWVMHHFCFMGRELSTLMLLSSDWLVNTSFMV